MQKRYQIDKQRAVQQFRRLTTETNRNIQMILPLAGIAGMLQEGVGHLMREAGLNPAEVPMPRSGALRSWTALSRNRLQSCSESGFDCSDRDIAGFGDMVSPQIAGVHL